MKTGERLHHVIEKAGGLTNAADAIQINLAALLEDGMVVYIPKQGETAEDQFSSLQQQLMLESRKSILIKQQQRIFRRLQG
ncbi:hypothetical protein [Metabacillus idriensis]|uniref:hypothetical protein n=1 Tax=Metabacillus idriensis TaxID=324768 RepID=UPI0021E52268|nr:hypothetical protein [Metabacillus idriensis]